MYSVEQLPRCDLLRLSPRLGDSSCRLDETPDTERREEEGEKKNGGGEVRLSTARESRRRSSYFASLVPLLLSSSSFAYNESNTPLAYLCYAGESNTPLACATPAKATRRAGTLVSRALQELKQHAARGLWFLARYAGESNTPRAYLCAAGESNTPRKDFGS